MKTVMSPIARTATYKHKYTVRVEKGYWKLMVMKHTVTSVLYSVMIPTIEVIRPEPGNIVTICFAKTQLLRLMVDIKKKVEHENVQTKLFAILDIHALNSNMNFFQTY
jgi:hypothetical protein